MSTSTPKAHSPDSPDGRELRRLLDDWPDIVLVNRAGPIVYANRAATHALGYSREELCAMTVWDLLSEDDQAPVRERLSNLLHGRAPAPRTCRMHRKEGGFAMLEATASVSEYDGEPAVFTILRDVSARIAQEEAAKKQLRESEERWQFALEGSDQGVWDWNPQTDEVFFSPRWKSMLGFEDDEVAPLLKAWSDRVHPDDWPWVEAEVQRHLRGEVPVYQTEHRVLCKDGTYKWILDRGRVISRDAEGRPVRVVGTHTDITQRKRNEQLIRDALAEKEVMLQEIHHRVKNNLQVISSLLNLQASSLSDPVMRSVLRESQGRVHSIALLHERLYRVADFAHIDLAEYVRSLVADVRNTFEARDVVLSFDVEAVHVSIDVAVPFSLMLNELVTNAFKHAFPRGAGQLEVRLHEAARVTTLVVRDDGVGLPTGFVPEAASSLGMKLVHTLTGQLRGEVTFASNGGTSVRVSFPSEREHTDAMGEP